MSRNFILLFYLLCSFNIIILCCSTLKHKSKDDVSTDYPFIPLNIFIDTAELKETCPDVLRKFWTIL